MEAIDIVSEGARVTIIVTEVTVGYSNKNIDYNRINYFVDYEKKWRV